MDNLLEELRAARVWDMDQSLLDRAIARIERLESEVRLLRSMIPQASHEEERDAEG